MFTVEVASFDDLESIAHIHRVAWLEAYADLYPQWFLASHTLSVFVDYWRPLFESDSPALASFIALIDEVPVGVGALLRGGEVDRFYVAPDQQGAGVGRAMLDRMEGKARSLDLPSLFAYVVEGNVGAEAFWARMGFRFAVEAKDAVIPCKDPAIAHLNMRRFEKAL